MQEHSRSIRKQPATSLLGDPSSSLLEGPVVRCTFGSWDDRWYYWPVLSRLLLRWQAGPLGCAGVEATESRAPGLRSG